MDVKQLVAESNRIEGITRPPTDREIAAFIAFLDLDEVTVADLENFVNVCQPGAKLRDKPGMDVCVGDHHPPPGGPGIQEALISLLIRANHYDAEVYAYRAHIEYEKLHPFMDGNGRSGRMLWYWMMREEPIAQELGFLHTVYYQALEHSREDD